MSEKKLKSHKFLVTTDEPEDGTLATGIVKHLADKRGRVVNSAMKRLIVALFGPLIVIYITGGYIDRAIQSESSGKILQEQISRPAVIGGAITLIMLSIIYSGIRHMTACCIQANWPKRNPDTPAADSLKQTLKRWWDGFDKIHSRVATLMAIAAVIISIIVTITS